MQTIQKRSGSGVWTPNGHNKVRCRSVSKKAVVAASASANARDMSSALSLANIRSSLIRQEDTIIFSFIERAQFCRNLPVYTPDAIPVPGFDRCGRRYSLLEYVLRETERLHGSVRRYTSPDEHAFYPGDLPPLVLPPITYPSVLHSCAEGININDRILRIYVEDILPGLTAPGDDFNYGSTATLDVPCLQALSKRIHYGKFVAEAKFLAKPEEYSALIRAGDAAGIMELLTDREVERRVVERVRRKAATFGQDVTEAGPAAAAGSNGGSADGGSRLKVSPDLVARVYEEIVMPLTKDVEVLYLLRRLDGDAGERQTGGRGAGAGTAAALAAAAAAR
ncbi:hypothetical protein PLESTB_001126400 [Pleodorina starrii]|uniref:Chorismate mutase n=1 Tax=Pleodorina starrii TaxID=330485 RepID=A0A9W6F548_9CHLO|nr:hypothetical protein PLESTM_001364000 [Pleodorina starrii]GLC56609.1 hypothetical protein PLESTB_001126400 [Pleodorina starrii]GLC76197.1 hypothetical protein PLESTF_001748600 [Pleodorina starrii]